MALYALGMLVLIKNVYRFFEILWGSRYGLRVSNETLHVVLGFMV
jgi:hypothetical protein